MRPIRRIVVSLALGGVTTIAVAWSCALIPRNPQGNGGAMLIDPFATPHGRQLYYMMDGTSQRRWFQFSVSYEANNSIGLAWEPFQGPIHYPEAWRLVANDRDATLEAMACFPNPRGFPLEQPRSIEPWPGWPEWPDWLPAIPSTPKGLVSYGARTSGWPLFSMRSTCTLDDVNASLAWHSSWQVLPHTKYPPSSRDPAMGAVPLAPIPLPFVIDTLIFSVPCWVLLGGHRDIRRWWRRGHGLCEHCGYSTAGLARGTPCPECGKITPLHTMSGVDGPPTPPPASA